MIDSHQKRIRGRAIVITAMMFLGPLQWRVAIAAGQKRPVTVADGIEMTYVATANASFAVASQQVALFSPDRRRFIVLLKKGNLERNTVDYSIYLFEAASALDSPKPTLLFTMASLYIRWDSLRKLPEKNEAKENGSRR